MRKIKKRLVLVILVLFSMAVLSLGGANQQLSASSAGVNLSTVSGVIPILAGNAVKCASGTMHQSCATRRYGYIASLNGNGVTPTATPNCNLQWRVTDTPYREPMPYGFISVAAISANDAWAVGYQLSGGELIERWDGQQWRFFPSPLAFYVGALGGLTVLAPNDIWAVGVDTGQFRTVVEHWDGSAWSRVPSPNPTIDNVLRASSAVSANDIWAVGRSSAYSGTIGWYQTLAMHWDGTSWTTIPTPNIGGDLSNNELWSVSAISSNDVWALGSYDLNGGISYPLVLHWDGKQWNVVDVPKLPNGGRYRSILALAPSDVWVGAAYGTGKPDTTHTFAMHWDGKSWQIVDTPSPGISSNGFLELGALGPNSIWAVGDYFPGTNVNRTLVEYWDGEGWKVVPSPNVPGFANSLFAVSPRTDSDVWAVGDLFSANPPPNFPFTLAMRYSIPDGCPTPTPNPTITPAVTNTATATSPPTQTATPPSTNTPPPQPTNTSGPNPTDTPLPPPATATPCALGYRDVPTEYWAYGYIKYLACAGLTSGYPDGTYRPGANISRAELARIVALAYGTPLRTPAQPSFADVPANYWAYTYIEGLRAAGIISGYSDGRFQPGAHISRAEIVKLVVAASGTVQYTGPFSDYPDVPQSHWAYAYIKTASQRQWVGGYSDGSFRPNAAATRAELAKTVYLALRFPLGQQ